MLEARDRVGGRGYSASLGGRTVELGGSWFTPEHDQVRAELARYGMSVRDYPPVRSARWLTAGELRLGAPVPWHELAALEAALARVRDDAERVAAGDQALAALSAADYVERLQPSDALRDFLLGWWQLMGGASPQHGAASDALGGDPRARRPDRAAHLPGTRAAAGLERAGRGDGTLTSSTCAWGRR